MDSFGKAVVSIVLVAVLATLVVKAGQYIGAMATYEAPSSSEECQK